MVFSILEISILDSLDDGTITLDNTYDLANRIKSQSKMAQGGHVKYIEELRKVLRERNIKRKID